MILDPNMRDVRTLAFLQRSRKDARRKQKNDPDTPYVQRLKAIVDSGALSPTAGRLQADVIDPDGNLCTAARDAAILRADRHLGLEGSLLKKRKSWAWCALVLWGDLDPHK